MATAMVRGLSSVNHGFHLYVSTSALLTIPVLSHYLFNGNTVMGASVWQNTARVVSSVHAICT